MHLIRTANRFSEHQTHLRHEPCWRYFIWVLHISFDIRIVRRHLSALVCLLRWILATELRRFHFLNGQSNHDLRQNSVTIKLDRSILFEWDFYQLIQWVPRLSIDRRWSTIFTNLIKRQSIKEQHSSERTEQRTYRERTRACEHMPFSMNK